MQACTLLGASCIRRADLPQEWEWLPRMSVCCLCRDPVPLDHRRRKQFDGESCSKARSVIKSLSDRCYAELSNPCVLLCQACKKKLIINISILGEKLETITLKSEVNGKLSRLQVTALAQKRTGLDVDTSHSLKQYWLLSTVSQAPSHSQAPDDVGIVHSAPLESPSNSTSSSQAVPRDPGPSPDIQVSFADGRSHDA